MGAAVAYFTSLGWTVAIPLTDAQKYDLLVDDGIKINRVQCKYAGQKMRSGNYAAELRTTGGNRSRNYAVDFDRSLIDYVTVLDGAGGLWVLPSTKIAGTRSLTLGDRYRQWKVL